MKKFSLSVGVSFRCIAGSIYVELLTLLCHKMKEKSMGWGEGHDSPIGQKANLVIARER